MQVPHANAYGDSDQMPLTSGDGAELKPVPDKYTFQPNPFLRS